MEYPTFESRFMMQSLFFTSYLGSISLFIYLFISINYKKFKCSLKNLVQHVTVNHCVEARQKEPHHSLPSETLLWSPKCRAQFSLSPLPSLSQNNLSNALSLFPLPNSTSFSLPLHSHVNHVLLLLFLLLLYLSNSLPLILTPFSMPEQPPCRRAAPASSPTATLWNLEPCLGSGSSSTSTTNRS